LSTNNNSPPFSSSPLKLHIPQLPQAPFSLLLLREKFKNIRSTKMEAKTIGNIIRIQQPNPARKTNSNKCKKMFLLFCKQIRWAFRYSRQQNANQKTHSKIEKEKESDGDEERTLLSLSLSLSPSPVVVFFVFVPLVDD